MTFEKNSFAKEIIYLFIILNESASLFQLKHYQHKCNISVILFCSIYLRAKVCTHKIMNDETDHTSYIFIRSAYFVSYVNNYRLI